MRQSGQLSFEGLVTTCLIYPELQIQVRLFWTHFGILVKCTYSTFRIYDGYRGAAWHLVFRRINFSWRHIGGIGCSLLIIFNSPIMVVQKSTKWNKMKYLTKLTRKKIEITTSIHYNISINSSINGEQTDQFFRYRPTFCECLKQYIVWQL